jgi:SAM-dependent methyltransferase
MRKAGYQWVARTECMHTPWQEIPLDEYEEHMSLPSVGQAKMLADQLERLIGQYRPASIALMGCAGGNGLERIQSTCVERIVAVDINAQYIATARNRFADRLANLDFRCADVQSESLQFEPVELIYAALIFEYVDVAAALSTMRRNIRHGGTLVGLLQLPHAEQQAVSPSPYRSLEKLASALELVAPDELRAQAKAAGFKIGCSETIALPSGKEFLLHTFAA